MPSFEIQQNSMKQGIDLENIYWETNIFGVNPLGPIMTSFKYSCLSNEQNDHIRVNV